MGKEEGHRERMRGDKGGKERHRVSEKERERERAEATSRLISN